MILLSDPVRLDITSPVSGGDSPRATHVFSCPFVLGGVIVTCLRGVSSSDWSYGESDNTQCEWHPLVTGIYILKKYKWAIRMPFHIHYGTYTRSKKFCVLLSNNPEAMPCLAILQYVMLAKKNVFMLFEYFAYHLGSKLSTQSFISKQIFSQQQTSPCFI